MKIAYCTLAAPRWTLEEVFTGGEKYGYEGLELYYVDGAYITPALLRANQQRIRRLSDASSCRLFSLGTLLELVPPTPERRAAAIAEGEDYLELARDLGADFIRLFGGFAVENEPEDWVIGQTAESLNRLAERAEKVGVTIALESHDFYCATRRLAKVLARVPSKRVVALWDTLHPSRVGESVEAAWANVSGRLGYLHLKDGVPNQGEQWDLVPLGEGNIPIRDILQKVDSMGFDGYVAFEWERGNYAHMADPEVALPAAMATIRAFTTR